MKQSARGEKTNSDLGGDRAYKHNSLCVKRDKLDAYLMYDTIVVFEEGNVIN